jgi:hypothetical protein
VSEHHNRRRIDEFFLKIEAWQTQCKKGMVKKEKGLAVKREH